MADVSLINNVLLAGDPLFPEDTDLIVQRGYLKVGDPVPDGWRVLTGNPRESLVARVVHRYEVEEPSDG